MNKIAKMRIPMEKMDEVAKVWASWSIPYDDHDKINIREASLERGTWYTHLYEDTEAFIKYEKVLVIEGESTVINPIVTRIMEVLKS